MAAVPSSVRDVLRSPGRPLDPAVRAFMEPRFSQDFSGVRVHTDTQAGRAAQSIHADAYTVGNDIVFAPGRFDAKSPAGRGLLAHELAHTLQQRSTIQTGGAERISRPGDPDERAADHAAEAVLADRPAPELAPVLPVVARSPQKAEKPGFLIKVVVNEPVDGREFCIRATMQGHRISRDEAESLLESKALRCYGPVSEKGVGPDRVGKPIPFRIGAVLGDTGEGAAVPDIKLDPAEKKAINEEADRRFWERIGEKRRLSRSGPKDAAERELWKREWRAVLLERHPVAAPVEDEYDPFSPELRRFSALEGLAPAGSLSEIAPDQFAHMMQVQEKLGGLSERDWKRLRRIGRPEGDWQEISGWLSRFIGEQQALEQAIEKVNKLDKYKDLHSAYEATHGMGRGSRDPVGAEAYGMLPELDEAAGEFRTVFRVRALEVAYEKLRGARWAMEQERSRMSLRQERESLFAALRSNNEEVLATHPILRVESIRSNARNPKTPDDLGDWLRGRAFEQIENIQFVIDHLEEKPDVVFALDVVVAATLDELGLGAKVHSLIISQGWGKSDNSSLFDKLLEFGKIVLMFVPVIGQIYGLIEGFRGFDEAMKDYSANKKAFEYGLRSTEPSAAGVVLGAVGLGLGAAPIPHGISSTARSFGKVERIAGREVSAASRAGTDIGAARAGEQASAAARVGDDVAAARVGQEATTTVRAGEKAAVQPVRQPVKGGHHVKVDERGIEICSPDPCPLLRVEYAAELKANKELSDRLSDIERLRLTDPKQAASAAGELRESLQYIRAHANLFRGMPAHVSPAAQSRLARTLDAAEDAGIPIRGNQVDELSKAIRTTKTADEAEAIIDSLEDQLRIHADVSAHFGAAAKVGGGSRAGDIAAGLPEATVAVPPIRYPKEVSAFLNRFPKVEASPSSEAALDALYAHAKSGGLTVTPRTGRYVPTETRSAAAEIESIAELSARPEVQRIVLVPSSREGRTVDKIVDIRQPDGRVVPTRWEDTTITGGRRGYVLRGSGGRREPGIERIETAILGKVTSTPGRPSQFDALMVEAPQGGTLAVHIPRPGPNGPQNVADAMANVAPELRTSSVQAVEFFLPGQQGLRRQVLRYVRQPNGDFALVPNPPVAP